MSEIDILDELQHVDMAPRLVRELDAIHSGLMQVLARAADEITQLRAELDQAREAAREMYTDVAQYDPCNHCPDWREAWPWVRKGSRS